MMAPPSAQGASLGAHCPFVSLLHPHSQLAAKAPASPSPAPAPTDTLRLLSWTTVTGSSPLPGSLLAHPYAVTIIVQKPSEELITRPSSKAFNGSSWLQNKGANI